MNPQSCFIIPFSKKRKPSLLGELADFSIRPENIQNKPRTTFSDKNKEVLQKQNKNAHIDEATLKRQEQTERAPNGPRWNN